MPGTTPMQVVTDVVPLPLFVTLHVMFFPAQSPLSQPPSLPGWQLSTSAGANGAMTMSEIATHDANVVSFFMTLLLDIQIDIDHVAEQAW